MTKRVNAIRQTADSVKSIPGRRRNVSTTLDRGNQTYITLEHSTTYIYPLHITPHPVPRYLHRWFEMVDFDQDCCPKDQSFPAGSGQPQPGPGIAMMTFLSPVNHLPPSMFDFL